MIYENQQSYINGTFTASTSGSPTISFTVNDSSTGLESTILSISSSGSGNQFYVQSPDMNDTFDSVAYEFEFTTVVRDNNNVGKLYNYCKQSYRIQCQCHIECYTMRNQKL